MKFPVRQAFKKNTKMKKKILNNFFGSLSKIKNMIITRRALFSAAFVFFALALAGIFWQQTSFAQRNNLRAEKINVKQAENVWQTVEKSAVANRVGNLPDDFQTLKLDKQKLASLLAAAPHESRTPLRDSELILQLPMPDGTFSRFRVQEAPVLEPSLQEEFPEIKSYRIFGIDVAATTGRFDLTPQGFHATILSPVSTISILPADAGDDSLYAVYNNTEQSHFEGNGATCGVKEESRAKSETAESAFAPPTSIGSTLRTYNIAFSTTFEYTRDIGGGTRAGVVSSINTWLNAMNVIYERELSIRFIMVKGLDTNLETIYTTSNDPYDDRTQNPGDPNDHNSALLMRAVRNVLRDKVGTDNYNIGHLLTENTGGGVAGVGVVCSNDTKDYSTNPATDGIGPAKAAGFSSLSLPVGNTGSLKVLAHEVGHQFGALHTFNAQIGSCAGTNRSPTSSYEVGSGNTIMSYFGVCGGTPAPPNLTDNVAGISDMRFHGHSFDQITDFVINDPVGNSCGTARTANNDAPTVNPGANYTIPKFTPFTLTATGNDSNTGGFSDLTYTWEQFQPGGTDYKQDGTDASYTDAGDPSTTTRPIFRATAPSRNPSRTFPSLEYILNNLNNPATADNQNDPPPIINNQRPGEELPRIGRIIPFRVTVRDNVTGVSNSSMTVTVDGSRGPFTVNDTTGTWTGGTLQTVTWNVNNTTALAANVKISLSTDGGQSFPITLVPSTPNNGSKSVSVPNYVSTQAARIKVEAIGNIFFDISGVNFSITPGGTCPVVTDISPKVAAAGSQVEITGYNFTGATAVAFNNVNAPAFTVNSSTKITVTVPTGATGGAITVTKPGCAVSESSNFTVCPGTASEIKKDDGVLNFSGGAFGGRGYYVNRLTPSSYPATLSQVKIFHKSGGFPVGKAITIISAANPTGGTNINNVKLNTREATIETLDAYNTYQVDPITITSGDFVVGYSFVSDTANAQVLAVDDTDFADTSYNSQDGITFAPQNLYKDIYMIRAVAYSGTCSSARCTAAIAVDDGSIENNGSGGAGTTGFFVNRLTPSSYPATLTGVRMITPFPTGTTFNLLTAADPSGSSNINSTSFTTTQQTSTAKNSFAEYSVAPITIYSGDFIIGYSVVEPAGFNSVSLDTTPPIQGRSYYKNGNFVLDNGVNYPIRAVLFSNSCSTGNCTYSLTTTGQQFSAEGGESTINIKTETGCPWRIARRNEWINVFVGSGTGNATVVFTVAENPLTIYRTGSFVVGPPTGNLSANNLLKSNLLGDNLPDDQEIVVEQEALAPTAASVSIGGRVLTSAGKGLGGAIVSLVDHRGQTRISRTNPFGYYRFDEIAAGDTIVLKAAAKNHTFTPQVVNANNSIANLDFISRK